MEARRARLNLTYNGQNISEDISAYLESCTYTDHGHGKADDLQITLENRDGLWRSGWFPDKGAKLTASLLCYDWPDAGNNQKLPLGSFEIDEIEDTGPPDTVTIKAASSAITKGLRREKKSRGWEDISLRLIALEIAECHGLSLFYDTDEEIEYKRIEQREESDLSFLTRICGEAGLSLKVAEEKLIVFEGKKFDARSPVLTLNRLNDGRISHRIKTKSHDIFRACQVTYWDPVAKEEKKHIYTPPDPPPCGHVLKITKRVETLAAAEKKARAELRRKNKNEVKGDVVYFGRPDLLAGINVALAGFGLFDGTYHVETARHTTGGSQGYTTTATIRKVLRY